MMLGDSPYCGRLAQVRTNTFLLSMLDDISIHVNHLSILLIEISMKFYSGFMIFA